MLISGVAGDTSDLSAVIQLAVVVNNGSVTGLDHSYNNYVTLTNYANKNGHPLPGAITYTISSVEIGMHRKHEKCIIQTKFSLAYVLSTSSLLFWKYPHAWITESLIVVLKQRTGLGIFMGHIVDVVRVHCECRVPLSSQLMLCVMHVSRWSTRWPNLVYTTQNVVDQAEVEAIHRACLRVWWGSLLYAGREHQRKRRTWHAHVFEDLMIM